MKLQASEIFRRGKLLCPGRVRVGAGKAFAERRLRQTLKLVLAAHTLFIVKAQAAAKISAQIRFDTERSRVLSSKDIKHL